MNKAVESLRALARSSIDRDLSYQIEVWIQAHVREYGSVVEMSTHLERSQVSHLEYENERQMHQVARAIIREGSDMIEIQSPNIVTKRYERRVCILRE